MRILVAQPWPPHEKGLAPGASGARPPTRAVGPVDYQTAGPTTEPSGRATAQLHLSARTVRHSPRSFQPWPAVPAITGSTTDAVGTMPAPSTGPSTHLPPLPVPPAQQLSRRDSEGRGVSHDAHATGLCKAPCMAGPIRQLAPGLGVLCHPPSRRRPLSVSARGTGLQKDNQGADCEYALTVGFLDPRTHTVPLVCR